MCATVSCVVPVYNGERYLAEALRSILAQTHPVAEVIVVDNDSTDDSAAIARGFGEPVRVVHQENRGPAGGRNRGVLESGGELITFLDADDLFHPEKLARQIARFAARPDLEVSLSVIENFWEPDLLAERQRYEQLGRPIRTTRQFGNVLARRSVFDRVGMLDETRVYGGHMEWFARVSEAGVVVGVLPEVLVWRRMHRHSLTHRTPDLDPYLDLARARIANRRRSRTA
jgi:glycosyltransferase involved in cell wall biosynthesis